MGYDLLIKGYLLLNCRLSELQVGSRVCWVLGLMIENLFGTVESEMEDQMDHEMGTGRR